MSKKQKTKKKKSQKTVWVVCWDSYDGDPYEVFDTKFEAEEHISQLIEENEIDEGNIRVFESVEHRFTHSLVTID